MNTTRNILQAPEAAEFGRGRGGNLGAGQSPALQREGRDRSPPLREGPGTDWRGQVTWGP